VNFEMEMDSPEEKPKRDRSKGRAKIRRDDETMKVLQNLATDYAAILFGKSNNDMLDMANKGCPRNGDGTWNLVNVLPWYIQSRSKVKVIDPKEQAQIEKLEADTIHKELQTQILKKNLIPKDEVERTWAEILSALRGGLETGFGENSQFFVGLPNRTTAQQKLREFFKGCLDAVIPKENINE
jgi:hypothetical protein